MNDMTETRALSTVALSSQEAAIVTGKRAVHGEVSERVLRLFDAIRGYGPPRVTLERATLFTVIGVSTLSTAAMVAYPLLRAAMAFMNEMASFESAGVSKSVR